MNAQLSNLPIAVWRFSPNTGLCINLLSTICFLCNHSLKWYTYPTVVNTYIAFGYHIFYTKLMSWNCKNRKNTNDYCYYNCFTNYGYFVKKVTVQAIWAVEVALFRKITSQSFHPSFDCQKILHTDVCYNLAVVESQFKLFSTAIFHFESFSFQSASLAFSNVRSPDSWFPPDFLWWLGLTSPTATPATTAAPRAVTSRLLGLTIGMPKNPGCRQVCSLAETQPAYFSGFRWNFETNGNLILTLVYRS